MKLAIVIILTVFVLVVLVSQVIVPMFSSKLKLFWIFSSKSDEEEKPSTLGELGKETKTAVKQVNKVRKKVEVVEKELNEIKSQF